MFLLCRFFLSHSIHEFLLSVNYLSESSATYKTSIKRYFQIQALFSLNYRFVLCILKTDFILFSQEVSMISFQMEDVKAFMNKLLLSQTFDAFHVVEGSIITYSTFHFDGHLHPDYYTKEEQEALGLSARRFARWQELRPFCLELIKGKRTPLGFRFTFQLSPENTEKLLNQTASPFSVGDVNGLALNIRYEDGNIICTTALSLNLFTMDKSLEHAWDQMVQRFFLTQDLAFHLL